MFQLNKKEYLKNVNLKPYLVAPHWHLPRATFPLLQHIPTWLHLTELTNHPVFQIYPIIER